jgi:serine/threonine protein kinase
MSSGLLDLLSDPVANEKEAIALQIDGYEVYELIGGGGMGEVYRAVRHSDQLVVALKVVAGRLTRDPEVTARFENEVSALTSLSHPNVVTILDQGIALDGRHFLVTEHVDGCDLRRLLRAQRLDAERAFDIFDKVCAAIAHAHAVGIVHRDIKPANILIGSDGTVKVADFGLAKTLVDDTHFYGFTQTRDTFGTPYYIAPEVTRQAGMADQRSDVYSLGVLLYELLSGAVPMGQYTPLSQRIDIDRRIDTILAEALADDPQRRTDTVSELAIRTRRLARSHLGRKQRSRLAKGFIAALIVLSLGASLGVLWSMQQQRQPTKPSFSHPSTASKEQPWKNSLGMGFVPLPKTSLLVAVHETRLRDFQLFSEAENAVLPEWRSGTENPRTQSRNLLTTDPTERGMMPSTWNTPGFEQGPDHPVTGIDLFKARLFCSWLTWRERQEGRLTGAQLYRLPRDEEWTVLASHDATDWQRNDAKAQANFAGSEVLGQPENLYWPDYAPNFDRRDPFVRTAPVGSFPANALGLHDLFGNVAEWVDTPIPDVSDTGLVFALRGGSWATGQARNARPDHRLHSRGLNAQPNFGFRLVLDLAAER